MVARLQVGCGGLPIIVSWRERERWHGSGGASGCDWVMAMMGGVGDWGKREKKRLRYFPKLVLQSWKDINQFTC